MKTAWSKKHPGRVANYCPICRDVQRHAFGYLYDQATRRSQQATECLGCGLMSETNADQFLAIKGDEVEEIKALMEQTHPMLPLAWWRRVAYDKGLIAGEMPAAERALAVREPFQVLGYLGQRAKNHRANMVRVWVAGACLLGIAIAVLVAQVSRWGGLRGGAWPAVWCAAASAAALVGCITFLKIALRGVTRGQILPMLARSLRPLRPSGEELALVFDWMKKSRFALDGAVTVAEVEAEIRRSADRSFTSFDADTLLRMAQTQEAEAEDARRRQIPGAPVRREGAEGPGMRDAA